MASGHRSYWGLLDRDISLLRKKNNGDMKCFFKEYFCVDTMHTFSIFIEVEALQDTTKVGKRDNVCATPFVSTNGSNKLSC